MILSASKCISPSKLQVHKRYLKGVGALVRSQSLRAAAPTALHETWPCAAILSWGVLSSWRGASFAGPGSPFRGSARESCHGN